MPEKKAEAIDYRAVAVTALSGALTAAQAGLKMLPDEGGHEPDEVKGARGMLLGVVDNLTASLERIEV